MQLRPALQAVAIGAASGLRTMAGPAALFRSPRFARVLPLLALGELIADKLPITPARTIPPALLGRAISGAIVGAGVARPARGNRVLYGLLGVAGAVGASYAGVAYRKYATRYVPAFVCALIEDAVAVGLAATVAREVRAI